VPGESRNKDIHPPQTPNFLYPYQQSPRPRGVSQPAAPKCHRRTTIEWLPSRDLLLIFHSNFTRWAARPVSLGASSSSLHRTLARISVGARSDQHLGVVSLSSASLFSPAQGRHSTSLIYLRRVSVFSEKTSSRQEPVTRVLHLEYHAHQILELPTALLFDTQRRGQALTTLEL
jgi:hypothetical protein